MTAKTSPSLSSLLTAESKSFETAYRWLQEHMPPKFFEVVDLADQLILARNLLCFHLQEAFIPIRLPHRAFLLCLQTPDADVKILEHFLQEPIRYYRTFVSDQPPMGYQQNLRIAVLDFFNASEKLSPKTRRSMAQLKPASLEKSAFDHLLDKVDPSFFHAMPSERLRAVFRVYAQAQSSDLCQYELRQIPEWKAKQAPSLQLILAWKDVSPDRFLYRLAQMTHAHGLNLQKVAAAYIDTEDGSPILLLSLGLHGWSGKSAWESTSIEAWMEDLLLLHFSRLEPELEQTFLQSKRLSRPQTQILSCGASCAHQILVHKDPYLYSFPHVLEALCRHSDLASPICTLFETKFHPEKHNLSLYQKTKQELEIQIDAIDTGQTENDRRRKNVLKLLVQWVDSILKTNFYSREKSSFCFRLDPRFLNTSVYERSEKFPELPFGLFFCKGAHFLGFHIRFRDLARGGVRTILPSRFEIFEQERNTLFAEAYHLAYTQQKKNKDIPEGGAKTALLLYPFEAISQEIQRFHRQHADQESLETYLQKKKKAYLLSCQRSFISSCITLINCDARGKLKDPSIVDYWKKPEYLYLGPDENMSNEMIRWICDFSVQQKYLVGRSFMSGHPEWGINHKEFGVTSSGAHVYIEQALQQLGIDPKKQAFTMKISGGPDGDVAGNEILNLLHKHPKTAKLLALKDISGTIYDPKGLNLKALKDLFYRGLPIRYYPAEKLSSEGFLLDLQTQQTEKRYTKKTLCLQKKGKKLIQTWLSGNEMHSLYRNHLHQVCVDLFFPAGGRPRTLNESNLAETLDPSGKPTCKVIVEGANLYLTPKARLQLEKLGTWIFKDSSCNKGGVICSSFEVLASLCMNEKEFAKEKKQYTKEVLEKIAQAALREAKLLIQTHEQTGEPLSEISDWISAKINRFKDQIFAYLHPLRLSAPQYKPFLECLTNYCPPLLQKRYPKKIQQLPDIHKKAILACQLAAHLVYEKGLDWSPTLESTLPSLIKEILKQRK